MPARLPELSPSSVGDLSCSKRYHELRVLNRWPPRTAIAPVARGSAFHSCMNSLYQNRYGDGSLDIGDLPALAREAVLRQSWPEDAVVAEEITRVQGLVKTYLSSEDPEDVASTVGCETAIGFVYHHQGVPLAYIKATLDRAIIRPDAPDVLVVKEYKTTQQRIELREALLLLWCARTKWGRGFRYELEYEWIDGLEEIVQRTVVTTDQVQGQLKLLVHSLMRVLHMEPCAEPGPRCTWCHMAEECYALPPVSLGDDENPFD